MTQAGSFHLRRGSTVFHSTAQQLGLVRAEGIPPLIVRRGGDCSEHAT